MRAAQAIRDATSFPNSLKQTKARGRVSVRLETVMKHSPSFLIYWVVNKEENDLGVG